MLTDPTHPDLLPRRKLKRVEYDQLVALGAFDDERIELLYGELVPMSPQGRPHRWLVVSIQEALLRGAPEGVVVQANAPVLAADDSEPEPDVSVYDRSEHHPDEMPSTIHLIIEVADSSRSRDLRLKRRLYAESRFPEYWVFDLVDRVVHVHRDPRDGDYQEVAILAPTPGTKLSSLHFPELALELAPLFPPPTPT